METLAVWLTAALAAIAGLFAPQSAGDIFTGYVEAEYIYVAPDSAGTIGEIAVSDGDTVKAGDFLFVLDAERAADALAAAKAALAGAQANLKDLETGSRPEEIKVIEQQWRSALENLQLARETFDRSSALTRSQTVSASKLDADRAALSMAQADVRRIEAQLEVARLPARDARIEAARQDVERASAEASRAEVDLARRRIAAPAAGRIERVFVDAGEYASAGTPVVSLLAPNAIKVRFFIPEPERTSFQTGDRLLVGCSSCASPLPARVTWLSSDAEHTPPIIFSREERSKLVFMVEARFDGPAALLPGQPVDVRRAP